MTAKIIASAAVFSLAMTPLYAHAADTVIPNGDTETSGFVLDNGDSIHIQQDGAIIPSGADTAVNVTGKSDNLVVNAGHLDSFIDTVFADGSTNLTVINSGSITGTSQIIAASNPTHLTVINSGLISATENSAFYSDFGVNQTLINSGTIESTLSTAVNFGDSSNSSIVNSGRISTGTSIGISGAGSTGLAINNSGSVTAATEAVIMGSGGTLTNSGRIIATASGANAIHVEGNDNTLIFNPGTNIMGLLTADSGATGNTLEFNMGSAKSFDYSTSGTWNLVGLDGRAVVHGSAISAGIGAQETADEMLYQRTSELDQSLARRVHQDVVTVNAGGNELWLDPYASRNIRSADGSDPLVNKYAANDYGLTMGITLPTSMHLDAVLNVESSQLDIDDKSQQIQSSGLMFGVLAPELWKADRISVSGQALVGYTHHNGDRTVLTNVGTGSEDIIAQYNSYSALAGVDGQYRYPLQGKTALVLSAGADFAAEQYESYAESALFSWDSRLLTQASANIGADIEHSACDAKLTLNGGVGLAGRELIGGKRADYTINTTSVSFTGGDNSDLYVTAHAGAKYQMAPDAIAYVNVSGAQSNNDVKNIQGSAGITLGF